jgi:hypothetical protein
MPPIAEKSLAKCALPARSGGSTVEALLGEPELEGIDVIDDERVAPLPLVPETTTDALQLFLRPASKPRGCINTISVQIGRIRSTAEFGAPHGLKRLPSASHRAPRSEDGGG